MPPAERVKLTLAERHAIEWECAQNTVRFYNRLDGVRGEEVRPERIPAGIDTAMQQTLVLGGDKVRPALERILHGQRERFALS